MMKILCECVEVKSQFLKILSGNTKIYEPSLHIFNIHLNLRIRTQK
jgi:hypothetical protein